MTTSESSAHCDEVLDIEEIHKEALLRGSTTYEDPATGFTVFTELAHLRRGKCCGNMCRHCPYGWENVKGAGGGSNVAAPNRRQAKLKSGDAGSARDLLNRLSVDAGNGAVSMDESKNRCVSSGVIHSSPNDEYTEEVKSNIESCVAAATGVENDRRGGGGSSGDTGSRKSGKGGRHGGKHTNKNVPYTRSGDTGTSQLFTGERRSKTDITFEAMGTVDELCCIVGTVHAELMASARESAPAEIGDCALSYGDLPEWLLDVMSRLFDAGSHIAKPPKLTDDDDSVDNDGGGDDETEVPKFTADGVGGGFDAEHIEILEDCIDMLTDALPELNSFILPTGGRASAQLHVARTVCRRAERRVVGLVQDGVCDPNVLRYLNRLSDFFFTAARWTNHCEDRDEIQYRRHFRGAKQRDMVQVSLNKDE